MTIDAVVVAERVQHFRDRIAALADDAADVRIIAVTKGFGPDAVRAARAAGLSDVGENYAQEAATKHAELSGESAVDWHFIGQLQTNKVKLVAPFVTCWQSLDRPSLIDEVAKRAPGSRGLIQVNVTDDPDRGGCAWNDVAALVDRGHSAGLDIKGLMTVGALDGPERARADFARLAALAADLGLPKVSMGMTEDFEIAVEEGATMIRLGRALFGDRAPRQ